MDGYERLPSRQSASTFRKWVWLVAIAAVAIGLLAVVTRPGAVALFELYWGRANIERLFYEDLGISQSWSAFIAVVGSPFYALAWIPLSLWVFRALIWRFDLRQLAVAFVCWVFVYGHVPLLHALLGTDACFNQRTGEPTKWYVHENDGRIVLFDSGGFDSVTGVAKQRVTTQICTAVARQKKNDRPRRITADAQQVEFFDTSTGRAKVWYAASGDGSYELFDAYGYHPTTSETLRAVTKEVVADIFKRLAEEEAARLRAEGLRKLAEEQSRKRAEEERHQAEELRKQAETEAQKRKQAEEAETQRRAEEQRRQAELEAAARAEERRRQAELEAKNRAEEESRLAAAAQKRAEAERRQAEAEARKQAIEERRRAEENRKQAEAEAQRRAEEQRRQAAVEERRRAEERRIIESYRPIEPGGPLCRNEVKNGEVRCECGHYATLGPCRFQ